MNYFFHKFQKFSYSLNFIRINTDGSPDLTFISNMGSGFNNNVDTIAIQTDGKIIVGGLSTKDASDLITKNLNKYLEEPTVSVRLMNFKISVLGEVTRPSLYNITNERVTLPEAISLAGDLTIYGKRQNVLIVREVDGKREFARIDLTKRDLFNSPYYYLLPNDIVYIEPLKGKLTSTSRAVQLAPIAISILTFLTIITQNFLIR